MVDSSMVLTGQAVAYTLYVLAIISLMAWFGYNVTRTGTSAGIKPALFYSFATMLVVLGVSLHIVTYNTIPWAPMDLKRDSITPDRSFAIGVANHKFILPAPKLTIKCNEIVRFDVTSQDLTYGFGLFRQDNSMMFQMQVVPGHRNDILWRFDRPGIYSIRSTEYSGPKGIAMIERDVVEVVADDAAQH